MKDYKNPDHYRVGDLETIDVIQELVDDFGSVCQANILKYAIRANRKHETPMFDIGKISRYCEFWANHLDGKKASGGVREDVATISKLDDLLGEQEKEIVKDKSICRAFVNGKSISLNEEDVRELIDALGGALYGED